MKATVTNTPGIMHLIQNASGRNRSVYEDEFLESVEVNAIHVMGLSFPHNDVEVRTQWFCKMKESDEPVMIWLDVDPNALEECTTLIEKIDEDQ